MVEFAAEAPESTNNMNATNGFKQYLGDSVYADFNGHQIVLTTENGLGASNTIYLEPEVYHNLIEFEKKLIEILEKQELLDSEGGAEE